MKRFRFDVSPEDPIATVRIAYPNTGFAFYLTRAFDKKHFRDHVLAKKLQSTMRVRDVPAGMTYSKNTTTLPGVIPEAVKGFLCEIHCVVTAQYADDGEVELRRDELRLWHHEIGHAADFARGCFPTAMSIRGGQATAERSLEVNAQVTELLCDAVDLYFSTTASSKDAPMSGFEQLFL